MFAKLCASTMVYVFAISAPAQAAIINVTGANLKSAFMAAKSSDTIIVTGAVGGLSLLDRSFAKAVTIDATKATFTDTLMISNVDGLKFIGGTFGSTTASMRNGRAVGVYDSSYVSFASPKVIGNGLGHGISVVRSAEVVVTNGVFNDLRLGVGIISSERVRVTSGKFNRMTSDGINIADSHRIIANYNRCTGTAPSVGAHPDCIQLWSVLGNPVQSDVELAKNYAEGATQGLTSFNASAGGGLRISMTDNVINTSYPQGLACYACVDSLFSGNILRTLPGSQWQTSMNIVGGSNNTIINNSIGPKPATVGALSRLSAEFAESADSGASLFEYEPLPDYLLEDLAYPGEAGDFVGSVGSAAAAVPEPMIWAQLLLGFGLTGIGIRRHRRSAVLA